jgi:Tol biopolymer transport system component
MSQTNRRSILGVALLASTLLAVLAPTLAAAPGKPPQDLIAFSARVQGISQLFTIKPNGTGLRQVTHSAYDVGQYGLTWSPDRSSLLYTVNGNGGSRKDEMVKSAADGSGAVSVVSPPCTDTCQGDDFPTYSPDGKKITFERAFGPNGNPSHDDIFTMNADGSDLTQLTQTSTPASFEVHQPRLSPNGKEIAFVRLNDTAKPSGKSAIEVMNTDGSNLRRLTPWQIEATDPRWSANGKRILFRTYGEPIQFKDSNLFTMRADGTHLVQLTHYTGGVPQAYALDWSPNGRQIIFLRFRFSGCCSKAGGYYILNLRTRHIRRLTPDRITYDAQAAWASSPG